MAAAIVCLCMLWCGVSDLSYECHVIPIATVDSMHVQYSHLF